MRGKLPSFLASGEVVNAVLAYIINIYVLNYNVKSICTCNKRCCTLDLDFFLVTQMVNHKLCFVPKNERKKILKPQLSSHICIAMSIYY